MIVTRKRKKPFPWKRLFFPAILIALIAGAFAWGTSRDWILSRPVVQSAVKPFDAVAQQRTIARQSAQIAALRQQLADTRSQVTDRDKQISQLQTQVNDAEQQAALATPKPAVLPHQTVQVAGSDLSTQGTPDMRRTADVWAAMDSEAAAKIVQRLPQEYVARVFALMSPDAAGAILENLPASYAAQLTQDRPELRH